MRRRMEDGIAVFSDNNVMVSDTVDGQNAAPPGMVKTL